MKHLRIEARLNVGVRWDEAARIYVSYSPALDIFSQGTTEKEAIRALESAMRMYLVTAIEGQKLDAVLNRFAERTSGGGPEGASSEYIKVLPDGGHPVKVELIPSGIE